MTSKNQNKPPGKPTRSPLNKKENIDEFPFDKRRKIGTANCRSARQVLSVVNAGQDQGGTIINAKSDCEGMEFSKDSVEALLNEKNKLKNKYDFKEKCNQMQEYIKKLKICIRWFQEVEENAQLEIKSLHGILESQETKHAELEEQMKRKEEELNLCLEDLQSKYTILEKKLLEEESDKLAAIDSQRIESDARLVAEKMQASLSDELEKSYKEKTVLTQKINSLEDVNKRFQEYNTSLQQYNSKLQGDNTSAAETIARIQKEKIAMMETMSGIRAHCTSLQEQLTLSKTSQQEALKQQEVLSKEVVCLRGELQQVRDDRDLQLTQVHALTAEIVKYKEYTGKSSTELQNLTAKAVVLEDTCASQKEQMGLLQRQLTAANEKLNMADLSASEKNTECEEQKRKLKELQVRLAEAELQIVEAEKLRKKLHNTILELKGNIRVFCRVRPLLPDDDDSSSESVVVSYPTSTELLGRGIELIQSGQRNPFTFDKVFDHSATQEDVFFEISQLVQSALDGYKVCIFAYGQTGSGKTYTMMGRPEAPEEKGLIPRSLEQIFQTSQSLLAQGWKFKMQASMLEIYNETIRDLLSRGDFPRIENTLPGKLYSIKHDANGNTHVSDLTIVDVCSFKEVSSLLHQAAQSRSVGKTQMNEQSSRSHFVFTLRISGVNESTEQQVQGVLNLIDLAGSERLSRSGATGERLKETQAINKSLSSLSDVIFSIAKKEDHVPFRNSKLTYLLQPCLGGDSKTLMFVNLSPESSSVNESLCSLRFAARVNACEIGVARRQTYIRSSDSRLSCG